MGTQSFLAVKNALLYVAPLSSQVAPSLPTHSPAEPCPHTPQGTDALAILSGQASSFSISVQSVSLTNLLWLLLPLFFCLRALLLSAQGKTECPCQESGLRAAYTSGG